MLPQPGVEYSGDLERQPQEDVRGLRSAGPRGGFQDFFDLIVVDRRNDRRHQNADGNVHGREAFDAAEPRGRRRDARLHDALQVVLQRRQAYGNRAQTIRSEVGDQVDIPFDQCALGNQAHRVPVGGEKFQQFPRNALLPFGRLVGVGIGADRYRFALVAGLFPGLEQPLCGIRLEKDLRLEIESRRQVQVRVRRSRVTVDAAVFAALVGIDGTAEWDIGRVIAAHDALYRHRVQHGRRRYFRTAPGFFLLELDVLRRKPSVGRGDGAATLQLSTR